MARSARLSKEAGFTLVELLVVVFIIALMAGLVVVNLPQPAPPAETHARALSRAFHQAARESIVSGQPIAWSLREKGGSRFERFAGGEWEVMAGSRDPRGQSGSGGTVHVEVVYPAGGRVPAANTGGQTPGRTDKAELFHRQIIFSPVGEATAAEIIVRSGQDEYRLWLDEAGEVTWRGQEAG